MMKKSKSKISMFPSGKRKRVKRKLTEEEKFAKLHPVIKEKIDKSLKVSIREGSYASIMTGFGTSYLTPFALALNATASQIGFLHGLLHLLPGIIQLKASRFIEKFSRKKIAILFSFLQALMFIPIIGVGVLFFMGVQHCVWILIGLITLFYMFGAAGNPAWFSWMGSLVPEHKRGEYFSKRSKITGFFGLLSMVIGALILDRFKKAGFVLVGFGILFFLAMVGRMISSKVFFKQYEPKLKIHKKNYFSLSQFLKKAPETPFGRFAIFTALMWITIGIATPFFVVYMLRDLSLSYVWYMAITVSASIFHLLFLPILGKFSDRFGNVKLLKVACFSFSLVPFLWLVSKNPFYLLIIPAMISGFAWSGFYLATTNYLYDSIRQEKRGLGIAYFNLLNGFGLFIGSGIGALIALMNITFMNKILFIFLISGGARILVSYFASGSLREVRHVKRFSSQFIVNEFHPTRGLIKEMHKLNHLKDKVKHYI